MYTFPCNVILTETQLSTASLVINSNSNASFYPSNNGNMYIQINYIPILTNKSSIISIPGYNKIKNENDFVGFFCLYYVGTSTTSTKGKLWVNRLLAIYNDTFFE